MCEGTDLGCSSLLFCVFDKIYKESTGTAPVNDAIFGDPVQKAEAMAFRRAFEGIFF